MDPSLILMLGLMLVVFIGLNMWTKRSNKKRQDEREQMLKDELVPGAWVHTSNGFYGRFVDMDGDVLILETPSGEETYWNKAVIRTIGDLPFAIEEEIMEVSTDDSSAAIEITKTNFDQSSTSDDTQDSK